MKAETLFGKEIEIAEVPVWQLRKDRGEATCPFCGGSHLHGFDPGDDPARRLASCGAGEYFLRHRSLAEWQRYWKDEQRIREAMLQRVKGRLEYLGYAQQEEIDLIIRWLESLPAETANDRAALAWALEEFTGANAAVLLYRWAKESKEAER